MFRYNEKSGERMRFKTKLCIAAMGFLLTGPAFGMDKESEDALKDTEDLLTNQQRLDAFAKDNPDAKNALADMNKLTGGDPKAQAEVNALSAAVFKDMVKANNGDDAAVMQKLQDGLKNPGVFLESLSPEQRAKLKSLAAEIDEKNAKGGGRAPASVK